MKKIWSVAFAVFLAVGILVLTRTHNVRAADCIYGYKTVTIQCTAIASGASVSNGATVSDETGQNGFHCAITSLDSIDAGHPPTISGWAISLAASPAGKFILANASSSGGIYSVDIVPASHPLCASDGSTISFTLTATPNTADACYTGASFKAYVQCPTAPPIEPPIEPPVPPPVKPPVTPPPLKPPLNIIDKIISPTVQRTVATSTAVATVGAIALASLGSSATNLIFSGWWNIFGSLGTGFARRKKRKSGRVIEEGTGMPIVGAIVELVVVKMTVDGKIAGQKTVAQTKTDNYGEYIFSAAPGLYKLEVHKSPYFISDNASASREEYEPNQILKIKSYEEGLVAPTIILALSQGEMAKKTHSLNLLKFFERALSILSYALMLFGTIVATNNAARHYNTINLIIVLIYIVLWGFILYNSRRRKVNSPWGEVYDGQNRQPLPLTLVRVMDRDSKKLIRTAVTDKDGKFSATVSKSNYHLIASKPGYVMKDDVSIDTKNTDKKATGSRQFINQKLWMKRGFLSANSNS
jgi:5-hydroxyisourate hydrolase-like protein (transthyretin family)